MVSAAYTQQVEIYTGQVSGQTLNSAESSVVVNPVGTTANVQVTLAGTAPNATFQPSYSVDGGAPIPTGVMFTSNAQGNATATFAIEGLAPGNHTLGLDINNTPAPGNTIYNIATYITFPVSGPAQQLQIYYGQVGGQTLNSAASSVTVSPGGGLAGVQITLAGTAPGATFQPAYSLNGAAPVFTGVMFTSDAHGNATATFTINDLAPGNYSLGLDINNTPSPGNTIYTLTTPVTFTVASGGF